MERKVYGIIVLGFLLIYISADRIGEHPNPDLNVVVPRASMAGSAPEPDAMVVYCTVPDQATADKLSESLVTQELAACVNIMPGVTSVYRWEGKVSRDPELLLIIKTRRSMIEEVKQWIKANHPYDVPEVIGLPILGGSPAYLQWLMDSTKPQATSDSM